MSARIRCRIYTRKSSDEGLEQEFNSLDAQREACAAYVTSQKQEGWRLVGTRYDDGGISGATLDRPGLRRLITDIAAGRIDMVVVYKIDRLTRSLLDFARIIETLDAARASFVSITQSFNTASSMGRLTLNMLLSFAQFEREVTAERIRDKIAASKKKGLWMGRNVPLGYESHPDPQRRELVANATEAETVRTLFDLYETHGCLRRVEDEARLAGLRSKARPQTDGKDTGARPLSRGQIHYLLRNPVYIGQIRHKTLTWPGLHDPIIDTHQWDRVQAGLEAARRRPRKSAETRDRSDPTMLSSPLTGMVRDETGDLLTPTHTRRHGRRLRYYVSNRLISGGPDPTGWRLPAPALEAAITRVIADHLSAAADRLSVLTAPNLRQLQAAHENVHDLVRHLRTGPGTSMSRLVVSARLGRGEIAIDLDRDALAHHLGTGSGDLVPDTLVLTAPFSLRRRGHEARIVIGTPEPLPDPILLRTLEKAHRWVDALRAGTPISQLARRERVSESFLRLRAQLAFLSPDIQKSILAGRQPPDWSVKSLLRRGIPLDWEEQHRRLMTRADHHIP